MTLNISGRPIGEVYDPLVVAEIGINHGGDLKVAKKMVLAAHEAGCECVKHQTHFVHDEMTPEAKAIFPPNADKSIWDVMEKCALSEKEEIILKKYTEDLGMIYISTPFSRAAADFLNEIGVPAFKIGSGECNHLPLVRHIAAFGKPIILSTGMQSISALENTVAVLRDANLSFALLECTNLYPSPPEIVSLRGIFELRQAFPDAVVGFSDHSIGPSIALAAAGLGACIIERHFTDSRYRIGPDVVCSMDPAELKFLIDRSREISIALRNPKIRTEPEEEVYKFARGSVVADKNIAKGQIISADDIWARRPGTGEISVEDFDKVVGAKARVDLKVNDQIKWAFLDI